MVGTDSKPDGANEEGFPGDKEMSKKQKVEEGRRWEGLHPEILALVFSKIPPTERVACLPLVCKSWMEVVTGPYCWQDIDIQAWCKRRNDSRAVDQVVKTLIARSSCTVKRLSVNRMGELGFFFVAIGGRCLKVLEIPMSHTITDHMVIMHMKAMPNLRVLDINYCNKITAKGLEVIGNQCKSLVHLKRCLRPPKGNPSRIDESEAKAISDTMPNLQRIELQFGRFGDSGLSKIFTKCKSLKQLNVIGCWNVKLNGDMKKKCEKLESFRIHNKNFPHEVYPLHLRWGYWRRHMNDKDSFVESEACKKGAFEDIYL